VNGDSQWRAAGWGRLLRTAALYPLNARYALLGSVTPPRETLARWDALLAQRHAAGIAGADAHNRVALSKRFAPRFPSYESCSRWRGTTSCSTRRSRARPARTRARSSEALRRGRGVRRARRAGDASGFAFEATDGARASRWANGRAVGALRVRAGGRMPAGTRVVLLRGREAGRRGHGRRRGDADVAGVYRAEAYVPWLGRALGPLEPDRGVRRTGRGGTRGARPPWPPAAPVPAAVETLDAFEGRRRSRPASTRRRPEQGRDRPARGRDGGGAARIAFKIGVPTDGHPDVFSALVDGTRRDLTGKRGLVPVAEGGRRLRIWIQVRDANPASKDEQTEWWFASLRTSTEWQRVAVPFAAAALDQPGDRREARSRQVKALVFVLDKGSVKPGTGGHDLAGRPRDY
jgi:hypothetical protein